MKTFLGLVLLDKITDRTLYQTALTHIEHSFTALAHRTFFRQDDYHLAIASPAGEFSLPKDSGYLATTHIRLLRRGEQDSDFLEFVSCLLEGLLVLKEHFPSRVEIVAEGGDGPLLAYMQARLE